MDYITNVPNEIKLKILSYLSFGDLSQVAQISTLWEKLAFDPGFTRTICLYKDHQLGDQFKNIILKIRTDCVTSLNINSCYWIQRAVLRQCIPKLKNLKHLYILDTKLLFCDEDLPHIGKLKQLQRLAISADYNKVYETTIWAYMPPSISALCIHNISAMTLFNIISTSVTLKEIWVTSMVRTGSFRKIMGLFGNVIFEWPDYSDRPEEIGTIKQQVDFIQLCQVANGTANYLNSYDNDLGEKWNDANWKTLLANSVDRAPFGEKDAKIMIKCQHLPGEMLFEELNFCHAESCYPSYRRLNETDYTRAAFRILLSSNVNLLKKLSIRTCLFKCDPKPVVEDPGPLFKRRRIVRSLAENKVDFSRIVDNIPLLEELEIWGCIPALSDDTMSCITGFQNLKKLTLDVTTYVNCVFLIDVCKECKNLVSLRIKSSSKHNTLNNYICLALPYATSLTDFRYEQPHIQIDKLLDDLRNNLKLQRIVIKTDHVEKFSAQFLNTFLFKQKSLRLLYIYISDLPKATVKRLNDILQLHKHIESVFIIANENNVVNVKKNIPYIHRVELIELCTSILVANMYDFK